MSDEELRDALDGLFAYDMGCVDSGVHDELLRQQVMVELHKDLRECQMYSERVTRIAREMFVSDEAITEGYGLADMQAFITWLDEAMRP